MCFMPARVVGPVRDSEYQSPLDIEVDIDDVDYVISRVQSMDIQSLQNTRRPHLGNNLRAASC
jgi:hypothetical protein